MNREPKDLAASVRARLLGMATPGTNDFQDLLVRYALERLLYRLSSSDYRNRFILKGAMLFAAWSPHPHRVTRDLDLLGFGPPDVQEFETIFRALCAVQVEPDGLVYRPETVRGERIREEDEYQGIRVTLQVLLKKTRIPVQVDVGTGDSVIPAPEEVEYPTLLGFPAPHVRAYSRYTVIAEKLETIVAKGILNSRMRDFYDIWALSRQFAFEGGVLRAAAEATFARRQTPIPKESPESLKPEFAQDAQKQQQWQAFLEKTRLFAGTEDFVAVIAALHDFLLPVLTALAQDREFNRVWKPRVGWQGR
jgi:predicted nucleotidyltransferase component of viral defense system